jgi:tripartite-type tricarboxylate transporter receptor subunit TctC
METARNYLFVILFSVLVLSVSGLGDVQSQVRYPTRAIDDIVAFGAGGGIDLNSRVTATYIAKKWGVPVNVVNKPGGKNIPATLELYKAAPDGYTMFGDCSVTSSLMGATMNDLPFDVMERTYIATVSALPYVISVPSTSPFKTVEELVTEAKKNPGSISFSAGDVGIEFAIRRFCSTVGLDITKMKPVMMRDAAQTVAMIAGGHVSLGASMVSSSLPAAKAGTLRPLLVTFKNRHPDLPNVRTSTEAGYPALIYVGWIGISGPPKLPGYVVDAWSKAIEEMVKDPEVVSQFRKIGAEPFYHDPKATRDYVLKDMEETKKLLK